MSVEVLSIPALGLVCLTSLTLLLVAHWRWSLIAIILQYLGVFILVSLSWPIAMSAAKFVAGVMAVGVLWLAQIGLVQQMDEGNMASVEIPETSDRNHLSGLLFRLFAGIMVALVVFSSQSIILAWIPELNSAQAIASIFLIGMGLLHLGLDTKPLGVILGLLTILCGFEIIYASVEFSALVEGLLAAVTLALALAGAYLILAPGMSEAT